MPAQTAKGYPYPTGTDRVADGDNAIQALAERVDTHLGVSAAGTVAVPQTTGPAIAVTFPAGRFTAPPIITTSGNLTQLTVAASVGATATGCTLVVDARNASGDIIAVGANRFASWIAIQV